MAVFKAEEVISSGIKLLVQLGDESGTMPNLLASRIHHHGLYPNMCACAMVLGVTYVGPIPPEEISIK